MSTAHVLRPRKFERPHMCRRRSRAGARHNVPGWELFGRARGSNAGRGARGGAFGSGSRKRGRKGAAAFGQGAGACASPWARDAFPGRFGPRFSLNPDPKKLAPCTRYVFLRPFSRASRRTLCGAEARERPSEHQTSVFSAIPCNQLITTWIPDPQPATEPFSHLRQTQGGP